MHEEKRPIESSYGMLIDGELTPSESGQTFSSFNPATGEELARVPQAGAEDVDRTVAAAARAFPSWRKTSSEERAQRLRELSRRLRQRSQQLALIDALDGGNPVTGMKRDVETAARQLEYFAGLIGEVKGETFPPHGHQWSFSRREPYGVVARILPFNHPLMFVASQLAAPLAAGNTLVLKPAEQTPLSALALASDLAEIFPAGVINILTGGGPETGAPLVQHPGIARVAFTGSVETGREVMRLAADGIKPVTLELGGKNPMIVFPDADLDLAVAGAVVGTNFMRCQGQSCGSVSRLFLHERIHEEFLNRLQVRVEQIRIGSPVDEATEMGCLVSPQHQSRVLAYIESGKAEAGVRLVTGGGPPEEPQLSRGCYVLPTILDGVKPQMKIAQEEIFGPVLSVLKWSDYEEVIAAANGVKYGLTASIWTQSLSLAHRAAADLEAGYVWINDSSRHFTGVPFGGYKQSGIGREGSLQELLSYTRLKSINLSF